MWLICDFEARSIRQDIDHVRLETQLIDKGVHFLDDVVSAWTEILPGKTHEYPRARISSEKGYVAMFSSSSRCPWAW